MCGAAVTGVAGDLTLAVKIVLVDGEHHLHHLASGFLLLLVVLVELKLALVFDVAEVAVHAERGGDELHRRD
jgi:hypothetical protein